MQAQAATTVADEFVEDFKSAQTDGLVDRKFYPGEVHNATEDDFKVESNALSAAMKSNAARPFSFDDSYNM